MDEGKATGSISIYFWLILLFLISFLFIFFHSLIAVNSVDDNGVFGTNGNIGLIGRSSMLAPAFLFSL